ATLANDPRVVEALVLVAETRHDFARAPHAAGHVLGELVRDREQQRDQRLLERGGYSFAGDRFEIHAAEDANPARVQSKLRLATRPPLSSGLMTPMIL